MKRATLILAALVLMLGGEGRAKAGMITYTETFTASGTFSGKAFTDAMVTIIGIGDTTNVIQVGANFDNLVTATVTVDGGSPATITDSIIAHVNPSPMLAGFADNDNKDEILISNGLFATYQLTTSIAPPVSGSTVSFTSNGIGTDQGTLIFTSVGATGTFGATVTAAPEPSTLALLGLGSLGLLAYGRRRGKA